ncbi:MAG: exodeoxyribonuclease VII small subunit [Lachnospiraceae bacterium]|nr:exodeoxyribonuclease VII small subunit [Lachnospiraceae bacterium]
MAKKEMTIEKAFTDIEEIIEKMEDDDITLDESMKLYNDGVKLLKYCNDTLDRTEKELIVLKEEDAADE